MAACTTPLEHDAQDGPASRAKCLSVMPCRAASGNASYAP